MLQVFHLIQGIAGFVALFKAVTLLLDINGRIGKDPMEDVLDLVTFIGCLIIALL